jgi:error-prone DNA polymerase
MGFYAPAQLVRDAREHGVEVREVDVTVSGWESSLEGEDPHPGLSRERERRTQGNPLPLAGEGRVRLDAPRRPPRLEPHQRPRRGFRQAHRRARAEAPFASVEDLARRARLDAKAMSDLAGADALHALTGHRHQAAWAVAGIDTRPTEMLRKTRTGEEAVVLAPPTAAETTLADYRSLGLTLKKHPLSLCAPGSPS